MEEKQTNLLAALRAIESNCVNNHAELLATDSQFQRITKITQMLIKALEKDNC